MSPKRSNLVFLPQSVREILSTIQSGKREIETKPYENDKNMLWFLNCIKIDCSIYYLYRDKGVKGIYFKKNTFSSISFIKYLFYGFSDMCNVCVTYPSWTLPYIWSISVAESFFGDFLTYD